MDNAGAESTAHPSRWLVAGPPILALLLLVVVEIGKLDRPLFFFFNEFSSYTGPSFWAHVTFIGDGLICTAFLLPWIRRHPKRVWGGLLGAILMVVVLGLFKGLLGLPRPLGVLPEELVTVIGPGHRRSAFPSGHTAIVALLTGVWALTTTRRFVPWIALSFAVLVGISRMAVGVHWPSDVLAGLALGWVSAWLGLRWATRFPWGMERPGKQILTGALFVSAFVLLVIDHTGYEGVLLAQRAIALGCISWGILELRLEHRLEHRLEPPR
jgi:membrane-associated phospholipid phosphatase